MPCGGDRKRCIDAGMNDYLSKPFSVDQLRIILERWIPAGGIKKQPTAPDTDDSNLPESEDPLSDSGSDVLDMEMLEQYKILDEPGQESFLSNMVGIFFKNNA